MAHYSSHEHVRLDYEIMSYYSIYTLFAEESLELLAVHNLF